MKNYKKVNPGLMIVPETYGTQNGVILMELLAHQINF